MLLSPHLTVDETRDDMGGALRARIFLLFAMLIAITSIAGSAFVSLHIHGNINSYFQHELFTEQRLAMRLDIAPPPALRFYSAGYGRKVSFADQPVQVCYISSRV